MLYEVLRSKVEESLPTIFGGAGPIMNYRARADQADINDYMSKLEGGEHISGKMEAYAPEEIKNRFYEMPKSERYSTRILGRAYEGFYTACHVFAYLSGRERSFGANWDKQMRICANMICTSILHIPSLYNNDDIRDINLEFADFGIDGPSYRPIVLNETLQEALRLFPVDLSYLTKLKKEETKKEEIEDKSPNIIGNDEDYGDAIIINYQEVPVTGFESEQDKEKSVKEEPPVKPAKQDDGDKENKNKNPESPVFNYKNMKFILTEDDINKSSNRAPANQEKKFRDIFGKYLEGLEYQVNKFPFGALECVIHKGDVYVSHIVDPGLAVGDGYYVMAVINTGNPSNPFDTIPVHNSEEEILRKVFNTFDHKYVLTPDEYQKALTHLFKNQRIYNVIDMSALGGADGENTKIGRIKKRPEDFRKLGQKLTFIINCIDNSPMLGRMRFSKFTSIDSFELRSDDKGGNVRSPFPPSTLQNKSGVTVQVEKDDVIILFNGNSQKYHIDNYGVL